MFAVNQLRQDAGNGNFITYPGGVLQPASSAGPAYVGVGWSLDQSRGSSFPTYVAGTAQRFWHTGYGMEFYWDGARWMSTVLHALTLPPYVAQPMPASVGGAFRVENPVGPFSGTLTLYITTFHTMAYVVNGTALSAANKWTGVLYAVTANGAVNIGTQQVDAGAVNNWLPAAVYINGTISPALYYGFQVDWTKTGTPGNLIAVHTMHYRYATP